MSEAEQMSHVGQSDATNAHSIDEAFTAQGELPQFEPYDSPPGGWGALQATAKALRGQSIVLKGSKALLSMNQPDGFDCPGLAHGLTRLVRILRKWRQGGRLRAHQSASHQRVLCSPHGERARAAD
jgi:hypothetical protein